MRFVLRPEIFAVDAVRKPIGPRTGTVAFQRFPFGARRRRGQIEQRGETLFLGRHFHAFQPISETQWKRLVARIFEPLLRIHVAEIQNLRRPHMSCDVMRDRGAMNKDQIEAFGGEQSFDATRH